MGRFAGRVALITGAGGAIGGAIARRLGAEGAAIAALDLDATRAEAIGAELGAKAIPALALACDVADEAAVAAAVAAAAAHFGRIDVLVNNAAMTRRARFETCSAAEWEAEVAVTLTGPAHLCRAVLPAMAARGAGAVVNIGSVNGMMYFGNPAYSAAKAGLLNLTRALAVEYGPAGV
ncbi:MAG: SDR family NAD(P)-dependent oxidoreductase, partial [Acetobacteraceae bacterium]